MFKKMVFPDAVIPFIFASFLLALSPGPDNLFVFSQSLVYGFRSGLLIVLGLCTGLVFHTLLVGLGIAALIAQNQMVYLTITWIGILYLYYVAFQQWKGATTEAIELHEVPKISHGYRRGIVMNITNPKVSLFFIAFLPQFLEPEASHVFLQIVLLGAIFALVTLIVFGAIAGIASRLTANFTQSPEAIVRLRQSSAIFIGLLASYLVLV